MKDYRLYHRSKRSYVDVVAKSAQEACEKAGWLIEDVWVRELTPRVVNAKAASGYSGGGWKYVTPREVSDDKRRV